MRSTFLITSALTLMLIISLSLFWQPVLWLLLPAVPLILMGLYDLLQKRHTIRRNFPLIGRMRWVMEKLRPFIRQYFIESDTDGVPISRMFRDIVYQRAKTVRESVAFGSRLDAYSNGYEWMGHSMAAITVNDVDINELRVTVGGPDCRQPYEGSILNVSAMSFGALSPTAILAINQGAKIGGFAQNTGEGGISRYHLEHGGDLIWQIGTGYFGCRTAEGGFSAEQFRENARRDEVRMIEIKLSQGAKPGHGGILPANKNTPEIARARGVEPYTQVDSPPTHKTFDSPLGLMHFISELRELSDGKPVGIKLAIGRESEFVAICKAMVKTGIKPDFITVDGGEGGTGAAPLEYANSVGMPLREALVLVDNCLTGFGVRDEIRVVASGKIFTAFHLVKHLALGADMVNSGRGVMLAAGCVHSLICNTNHCPSGVATQDPALYKGLVVSDKAPRVARFQRKTLLATADLIASAGLHHTAELNRTHIFRRVDQFRVARYDEIFPYVTEGVLLGDNIPERYAVHMEESNVESFFPKHMLTRVNGGREEVSHSEHGASIVNSLLAGFLLCSILLFGSSPGHADISSAQQSMEDDDNPLMLLRSARGDIYIELFPEAAPLNVERFRALADGELPLPDPQTGEPRTAHYYDGLSFQRIIANTLIQGGEQLYRNRGVPDDQPAQEINARALGLHEQQVIDSTGTPHPWLNIAGKSDFDTLILAPLYQELGISRRQGLAARQDEVWQRLQDMTLQQAYERLGYRYDSNLDSRAPGPGSVVMVADGAQGNTPQFFITLRETPWLAGTHTVIGQVVTGMEVVMQINRSGGGQSADVAIYQLRSVDTGPGSAVPGF